MGSVSGWKKQPVGDETFNGITTAGHAVLLVTSRNHSLLMDLTDDAT